MATEKLKRVGSGITEGLVRETWLEETEAGDALLELLRRLQETCSTPWAWHAPVIRAVQKRWREINADRPARRDDYAAHKAYNRRFRARDTEEWYVREIVKTARAVELAVEAGRPWEAVARAMQVGELLTELRLKGWDDVLFAGMRHRSGREDAAAANRRSSREARREGVRQRLAEGHSLVRAFELVAREHPVTAAAIKKDWYSQKSATGQK